MPAINTAISALQSSAARINTSAQNIASYNKGNVEAQKASDPFAANSITKPSVVSGAVKVDIRNKLPESQNEVDIGRELINQKIASYDFKANLKVLETIDEMDQYLLDIEA